MILKLQNGKPLPSLETIKRLPKRQLVQKQQSIKAREKTERWTKEQINKAKNTRTWRSKIADALHIAGVGLTGTGLIGSFVTAPAATALGIAGGITGEKVVNKASKKITGRTWDENMKKYLGLSPTISALLNPGGWIGGGIGVKASKFRPKAGYLGMNGVPMKPTKVENIFNFERWFRERDPKYVTEQDKKILTEHLPEYKRIQEEALDNGTYMQTSEGFPNSVKTEDGRYIFQGDEGSWIQSQSKDFKTRFGNKTLKIGYKGGTDQKAIEGGVQEHAPETFPEQGKGIFFAADKRYADRYNHGSRETPGFWLGFDKPYDMINGGQRPFLLESEAIRYMRSIDAMPSFKNFPNKPFEILENIWGDLSYLKDPKIMSIITKDPNKMTKAEMAERVRILSKIRAGQNNDRVKQFGKMVDTNVKSGRWQPTRSTHYDGYIGRDHTLLWSPENDIMAPFGSHPESYVITKPGQASILIGNNGMFSGPAYSRKCGGKLKFK